MGTPVEVAGKSLLLFDGVCNLCNGTVNFIIDRDPDHRFVFASLQSTLGQQLTVKYLSAGDDFQSMVLIKNNKAFVRSDAALEIARDLSGGWPLIYALKIIPKSIRNALYNTIAAHRYKWFGRQDQCIIPSADRRDRFVSL